jgi:hypothetical protein
MVPVSPDHQEWREGTGKRLHGALNRELLKAPRGKSGKFNIPEQISSKGTKEH